MLSTTQSAGAERRAPPVSLRGALFSGYALDHAYDEMFDASRRARPHCRALVEALLAASLPQLRQHQTEADKAFLTQGITFTVYGDEAGTERIFPYDLLPRIITAAEWATIERGLTQRLTAINLFLRDIYHEGRILSEGIVPRDLVYSCRHYRREMRGVQVHGDRYVSIAGTDLVRLEDGRFVVLEDNLRVPSGVSYMLANREVMKRVFPGLFARYSVSPIADYGQTLLATLRALAPPSRSDPTVVVLTPGVGNSAYFEHAFLAREMGVALVEGRDLLTHDNVVYMRTTSGLRRVDVGAGTAQRIPGRQRVARECDRHRRGRRQGDLCLRPRDHPVLSVGRAGAAERRDVLDGQAV